MSQIHLVLALSVAIPFAAGCDSAGASGTVTAGEERKSSSVLERPGTLGRAPGKGLPPELRPPR